ncbi:hypothetical protein RhiLY_08339 [Ceratobasidium sp. AG-Ba]|nr:hypothetical protein RhiLY_08339 [Ceratobasidium sp. AG-Ba]
MSVCSKSPPPSDLAAALLASRLVDTLDQEDFNFGSAVTVVRTLNILATMDPSKYRQYLEQETAANYEDGHTDGYTDNLMDYATNTSDNSNKPVGFQYAYGRGYVSYGQNNFGPIPSGSPYAPFDLQQSSHSKFLYTNQPQYAQHDPATSHDSAPQFGSLVATGPRSEHPTPYRSQRPTQFFDGPAVPSQQGDEVVEISNDDLLDASAIFPSAPSAVRPAQPCAPLAHPAVVPTQLPIVPVQPPVPNWAQLEHQRFLEPEERAAALFYLKDGMTHMLWEKQGMLDAIAESGDQVEAMKQAMRAPRVPTKTVKGLAPIWDAISYQSSGNKRSMHLVITHFWKMVNTCKGLRDFMDFTGGGGDGDADPDATLLDKLGRKLNNARKAGITSCDDLTPAAINAWIMPRGGSMFDVLESLITASQSAVYHHTEYHSGQGELSATPGHDIFSPANSTGPSRTHITRNSATNSPISTQGRFARPHVKKETSQTDKTKAGLLALSTSQRSNASQSGSDIDSAKVSFIRAQEAKAAESESRINATLISSNFLTDIGQATKAVKHAQAEATRDKAQLEMKIAANKGAWEAINNQMNVWDRIANNTGMDEARREQARNKMMLLAEEGERTIQEMLQLKKDSAWFGKDPQVGESSNK